MPEYEFGPEVEAAMQARRDPRVPIIEEEAHVLNREVGLEHVIVRTVPEEYEVVVRDLSGARRWRSHAVR